MPSVIVMGSCLANLAAVFLVSEYKWERPANAAVLRSDHFVEKFIDETGYMPTVEEFSARVTWKAGFERDGVRFLNECYRDKVGHIEIPMERPGLFEVLANQKLDLIMMDNLFDTHTHNLHYRAETGEKAFSLPVSLSRCENERELAERFYYSPPLDAAESVSNWVRIIRNVREQQPTAQIRFYCAHSCTSVDLPDRFKRAHDFPNLLAPFAQELDFTIVPPLELPVELTRMPEDRDHFDFRVYRAMAGEAFISHLRRQ
jgi:hypothetical protein